MRSRTLEEVISDYMKTEKTSRKVNIRICKRNFRPDFCLLCRSFLHAILRNKISPRIIFNLHFKPRNIQNLVDNNLNYTFYSIKKDLVCMSGGYKMWVFMLAGSLEFVKFATYERAQVITHLNVSIHSVFFGRFIKKKLVSEVIFYCYSAP